MNQLSLVQGFYVRGAIQQNLGGMLVFEGFSSGVPIFAVNIGGLDSVTTSDQMNVLVRANRTVGYANGYGGSGTVTYVLPAPDPAQRIIISNQSTNSLLVQAPAGSQLRMPDGSLHSAIQSVGNPVDNIALIGLDSHTWQVTYLGESGQSTWTPA